MNRYLARFVTYDCRFCDKSITKRKKGAGFCDKSCASKYYVANGTYDKWKQAGMDLNKEKDQGTVIISCVICDENFERKVYKENIRKQITCSYDCKYKYMSENYSGEKCHLFGKKSSQERKDNIKKAIFEKYGVTNPFLLTKIRKTVSKGQLELFTLLTESLIDIEVQKEKRVNVIPKEYYADILLPKHDIIVEYNGDFWHANPNKYPEDYYNPKKQLLAREIWELDKIRLEKLKEKYKVYVVWESDFAKNKKEVVQTLVENIKNDIK
jgi:G:T-mismatch repair DNA endonuclease (very short patch repair protein)